MDTRQQLAELRIENNFSDRVKTAIEKCTDRFAYLDGVKAEQSDQWATDPLLILKYLKADYWRSAISEILHSLAEAIEPDDQD